MQAKIRERIFRNGKTLMIFQGDLLECVVDCIIIGANPTLHLHSGMGKRIAALDRQVNRDVSRQTGYVCLQDACQRWVTQFGTISAEKPAYTPTSELPFQTVIHTVAPVWNEQTQEMLPVYRMMFQAFDLADLLNLRTMAISPQIFANTGTPEEKIAHMLISGAADYLQTRDTDIDSIWLVVSADDNVPLYKQSSEKLL